MFERRIKLEGIANTRQLGGLSNNGLNIKNNCLIRSAHLYRATSDDINILKNEYKLKRIIDLRRSKESKEKPDNYDETIEYHNIPVFDEIMAGISHDKESDKKIQYTASDLKQLYEFMVIDPDCQKNFSDILKVIINHDYEKGSILWHCSEGKDRCGLISAFILYMLGFSYQQILEDYLITNETNNAKTERIYNDLIKIGKKHDEAKNISELYLAKEEFLKTAIDAIIKKYKSIDNYFINALKIEEKDIDLFRNKVMTT